jgi:serine/threonine protein phosphatase 1
MRTLVVGDIHGGFRALQQLFEKIDIQKEDHLIFLGDYVDGWSESFETMDFLMELLSKQSCVILKGNHDFYLEQYLDGQPFHPHWLKHGGQSTFDQYQALDQKTRDLHLEFLKSMPLYHIDDKQRLFVHAGYTSMHGPEREHHESNFFWDRTLWETAVATNPTFQKNNLLFPKRLKHFKEIYIGHTPTLHLQSRVPLQKVNVWNMDTGAAFVGALSAMDIDTKELWQSDLLINLYPDEMGRNKNK